MVRRLIWWQKARRSPPFPAKSKDSVGLSGISTPFEVLSQIVRQIIYALLTRAPLTWGASPSNPFDLHVLGTPPAFVLSQDQTLQFVLKVCNSKTFTDKIIQYNHLFTAIRFSKTRCATGIRNILGSANGVNNYFPTTDFSPTQSGKLTPWKEPIFYHK